MMRDVRGKARGILGAGDVIEKVHRLMHLAMRWVQLGGTKFW